MFGGSLLLFFGDKVNDKTTCRALKAYHTDTGEREGSSLIKKNSSAKEINDEAKIGSCKRWLLNLQRDNLGWGESRSRSATTGAWSESKIGSIEDETRFWARDLERKM